MRTAVTTRKGPDVFEGYASPFMFDYYNGLLPLDKYRTAQQKKDLLGWASLSAKLSANGTPYSMPWSGQGINLYYNKALFKKAGLDPNKPPKTWAQLLAACAALKKAGIMPITAGWKDGYYAEWWVDVLAQQYMTPAQLASSGVNPNWQAPWIAKSFARLLELSNKGYMTPNAEAIPLFPDVVNNFGAGKGAIFMGLAANNANYSEFAKAKIGKDLGAFLPPLLPDAITKKQAFDYGPGLSWSIAKWSKNPDAAYKFLTFLGSPKAQAMVFKSAGTVPNNITAKVTTPDKVGAQILRWIHDYPLYVGQVTLHPRQRGAGLRQGRTADHDQEDVGRRRDEAGAGRARLPRGPGGALPVPSPCSSTCPTPGSRAACRSASSRGEDMSEPGEEDAIPATLETRRLQEFNRGRPLIPIAAGAILLLLAAHLRLFNKR